jgi:aspartyl-tRNA(Asn)/glutamyl-tRNA(Gln) amidotransferase subunit A
MDAHSESELAYLSIEQAARLLRRKEISPVDLVEAALARIERWSASYCAFLTVLADSARRQARLAEREIRRGRARGPLHGIPISLKDNFHTRGVRTTAGSKILADFVPDADSDVAKMLARAGAILLGKTNMHEFAYGITGENPHYGSSRNIWAHDRISGGSSGGSAVAVGTGMGFVSVGTDTGGSIRIPAALCGLVGLKPTYGLVSAAGVVPLAISFDHCGPIARSVADACIVLETIAGKYPRGETRPDYRRLRKNRPRRFRVGLPAEFYFERLDPEVRRLVEAAAKRFESLGARVEQVSLPRLHGAIGQATLAVVSEASAYHESQGYYPARAPEYGDDVRGHLEFGSQVRAVDYLGALTKRREIAGDFEAAFEKVDVILAPTSPIPAPRVGETEVRITGERETTTRAELLRLTRPANLTGFPALSIPCGFTRAGLPVGLQLMGPRWSEARLLSIALAYEEATEWHTRRPSFVLDR